MCCTLPDRSVSASIFRGGTRRIRVNADSCASRLAFARVRIVHSALPSNTLAVYGRGQNKELTELVPGILNQLGPDSLASLRKLAESYQALTARNAALAGGKEGGAEGVEDKEADEAEDDIPDLVENFDEAEGAAAAEGGNKETNKLEELN